MDTKRVKAGLLAGCGVLGAAALFWFQGPGGPPGLSNPVAAPSSPGGGPKKPAQNLWFDAALGLEPDQLPVAAPPVAGPASPAIPPPTADGKVFGVDLAGNLKLDERMRVAMENLVVLTPPERLHAVLDQELAGLPPKAAAAARDLVTRYQGYDQAQKLSSSSAKAPLVPEEGLAELEELRALRNSYFGEAVAQRLYGEEEAVTRRLLELMREDPMPDAPMAEKAVRAQARYDALR